MLSVEQNRRPAVKAAPRGPSHFHTFGPCDRQLFKIKLIPPSAAHLAHGGHFACPLTPRHACL